MEYNKMSRQTSEDFKRHAENLENLLSQTQRNVTVKDYFPTLMIIGAIVPFVILGLLYFTKPGFIKKSGENPEERDSKKLFYWTAFISLVIWAGIYGCGYYMGLTR